MPDLPSSLALSEIEDGTNMVAAPVRNNFTSLQERVNAIRAALAGGSVGQVLQAVDADTVQWQTLLQLVDVSQKYKLQFDSTAGVTDSAGAIAVTFPTPFATAVKMVLAVNGDTAAHQGAGNGVIHSTVSVNGFAFDTGLVSAAYRVNWVAIGY